MKKRHRLFFALLPCQSVRDRIAEVQNSLHVKGRKASPHQFHATLAFLGMQDTAAVPAIMEAASRQVLKPCRIMLDRFGTFGRSGVLWLGANQVPNQLIEFQQGLVEALLDAEIGHDRKPWEFHVTLYRKMRKRASIMDAVAIEWAVNGFDLIESVSVGSGVEYHSIRHWDAGR